MTLHPFSHRCGRLLNGRDSTVLLAGDLGSYHSDISEEVFRGFALADNIAPFIVINDNDAAVARSFTLMYELGHIWLGTTGISEPLRGIPTNSIERCCNEVAGEFLLPAEVFDTVLAVQPATIDLALALSIAQAVARDWNISQSVVITRLLLDGRVGDRVATEMFRIFARCWREKRKHLKDSREKDEIGPSSPVVMQ